jgi:hypothetical protein
MGINSGRRVGLTNLPPSMSRMSENVGASTSRNPKGLRGLYMDSFLFTYFYVFHYFIIYLGSLLFDQLRYLFETLSY